MDIGPIRVLFCLAAVARRVGETDRPVQKNINTYKTRSNP
jgi:hypothetical protein